MQSLLIVLFQFTPSQWVLILFFGIPIFAMALFLFYRLWRSDREKIEWLHAKEEMIAGLVDHGEKIMVPLRDCDVVSKAIYSEPEYITTNDVLLGQVSGPDYTVFQLPPESHSTILKYDYKDPLSGREISFVSSSIPKDRDTVRFYTTGDRNTFIYFDKEDPNRYYFDLSFFRQGL